MENQEANTVEAINPSHSEEPQKKSEEIDIDVSDELEEGAKNLPPEIQRAVEKLPPEARTEIIRHIRETTIHGLMMSARDNDPVDPEFLKQQDDHKFQVAMKGIDAQQTDRRETRIADLVKFKIKSVIFGGVVLALIVLVMIAMYNNNTDFILKLLGVVGVGIGGYGGAVIVHKK